MPADRLKVRDAAEEGYEVLEDGGEARPRDFEPSFLGSGVGRVLGKQHGPSKDKWFWTISTNDKR
jgi:hypothetical protein